MFKLKSTALVLCAVLLIAVLVSPVAADYGIFPVPSPVPTINTTGYSALNDTYIGTSFDIENKTLDLWGVTMGMIEPFKHILGNWVFIILIFCWILSLWFRTSDISYVFIITSTVLPLMSAVLFPEQMIIYIMLGAVGVAGIIYKIVKSRR